MNKAPVISGSCACGATKWTSSTAPTRGSFCYCSICRKVSGGAFAAFMDLPISSVTISGSEGEGGGKLEVMSVSKNAERGFCSACGSTLTMRYLVTPENMYLTIGSVDVDGTSDDVKRNLEVLKGLQYKHLYVKEKVPWYQLPEDRLPRWDTMPNESKYLIY